MMKYRPRACIWIAWAPYVCIVHPPDVEVVLSSTTVLEKADHYDILISWIGRGLLTAYGNYFSNYYMMVFLSIQFQLLLISNRRPLEGTSKDFNASVPF